MKLTKKTRKNIDLLSKTMEPVAETAEGLLKGGFIGISMGTEEYYKTNVICERSNNEKLCYNSFCAGSTNGYGCFNAVCDVYIPSTTSSVYSPGTGISFL